MTSVATLESSGLNLEAGRIVQTVEALNNRIDERFAGSGLGQLAQELHLISTHAVERLALAARPIPALRAAIAACIIALAVLLIEIVLRADFPAGRPDIYSLVDVVEASSNILFFIGLMVLFLVTLESRIKRRRALHFLRELRALAHIIDMHQLTKDPDSVLRAHTGTASSPERELTQPELARYLDYCSEMLSLVSKVAALYAQNFDDPVVLAAVDEVEGLTTGLSSKIWQKIIILDRTIPPVAEAS